ncbi:MAG: IPT/TIG domain-containing protein, partial [Planctomycetes bacterium]|nr:IPT/TIG domain-containing protein [Planctomycetota bacterium]
LTDAFTYGTPGSGLPSIALITPDSGYAEGGDSVTITGENLASPLAVTFNGVASTIISSTSSRIDVRTPAGPIDTDVDVRVTTTAGSDTVFGGFRYLSLTAPSISSTGAGAQAGGIGICSLHWNGGWVAAFIALSSCALSLFTRRRDKAAQ